MSDYWINWTNQCLNSFTFFVFSSTKYDDDNKMHMHKRGKGIENTQRAFAIKRRSSGNACNKRLTFIILYLNFYVSFAVFIFFLLLCIRTFKTQDPCVYVACMLVFDCKMWVKEQKKLYPPKALYKKECCRVSKILCTKCVNGVPYCCIHMAFNVGIVYGGDFSAYCILCWF